MKSSNVMNFISVFALLVSSSAFAKAREVRCIAQVVENDEVLSQKTFTGTSATGETSLTQEIALNDRVFTVRIMVAIQVAHLIIVEKGGTVDVSSSFTISEQQRQAHLVANLHGASSQKVALTCSILAI